MSAERRADQRYYASTYGRFNTADQYLASAGPGDPGSWNRYSYTRGDPVNRLDPRGLEDCPPGVDFCVTGTAVADSPDPVPCSEFAVMAPWAAAYLSSIGDCVVPSGYGGAGGGEGAFQDQGTKGQPGVTLASQAPAALAYEIAHLTPNCEKVLPTKATLTADAGDLQFWDARIEGIVITSVLPGVVPFGRNPGASTLAREVGNSVAVTLQGRGGTIAPVVVLGAPFFNESASDQGLTLLHELLHYATQAGDVRFDEIYGITGRPNDTPSQALSNWLLNDCKN